MRYLAILLCLSLLTGANSVAAKSQIPPAFLAAVPDQSTLDQRMPEPEQTLAVSASAIDGHDATQLKKMVGQMIVLGFPGTRRGQDWPDRVARMIQGGQIGGTILFAGNIVNAQQLSELVAYISRNSNGPLPFACIDQEGGAIQRLTPEKGFVSLPSARSIGKLDGPEAYRLYHKAASQLAALGVNVNFGPVVDLDTNATNPAIGQLGRSYDSDPKKVVSFARQFIDAHRQAGVMTAVKHFPGHGSAKADPHDVIVNIDGTWKEQELIPFRELLGDNSSMVMVGHLIHRRFSDGDLPASLSKRTISDTLRKDFGFRGLVITDDLDMDAIQSRFRTEEAAVLAIAAGADLIIIANNKSPDPKIVDRVTSALIQAVEANRIPLASIQRSYTRIMSAKAKLSQTGSLAKSAR